MDTAAIQRICMENQGRLITFKNLENGDLGKSPVEHVRVHHNDNIIEFKNTEVKTTVFIDTKSIALVVVHDLPPKVS